MFLRHLLLLRIVINCYTKIRTATGGVLMRKRAFWFVIALMSLFTSISGTLAQTSVTAVVINEFANVRTVPAIGADVIATVPGGWLFDVVTGRSPDNEWIRVDFNGTEGWVNLTPLAVLSGDLNTLPVADPRSIPYGGFDTPRAGLTNASSDIQAQLTNGLRVRAGPSTGYPVFANAPINSVVPLLGRNGSSTWVQINFEGTLGWISTQYIEILNGASLAQLPFDGIVADSLALSEDTSEDYIGTLRLLLARLDLAQPSLDNMRSRWTDSALTGRANCQAYPARPSDYNVPNELLAAFYLTLNPLHTLFNDAMFNVRQVIDLTIQACNQAGTVNPVGQATVIGALEIVAVADSQFQDLRNQILALIPPDRELGPNECLFSFGGASEILAVLPIGVIAVDSFDPTDTITGYCVDAVAGQNLIIETAQLGDSNIEHLLSFSPIDNPTNFIATGQGGSFFLSVGPVTIPTTGRYLLVLSDISNGDEPINGSFAILITSLVPGAGLTSFLTIDPITGQPVAPTPQILIPTGQPIGPGVIITTTPIPAQPRPIGPDSNISPDPNVVVCPGTGLTCDQLASCEQAYACLDIGNFNLDPDNDGVPCEVTRCPATP